MQKLVCQYHANSSQQFTDLSSVSFIVWYPFSFPGKKDVIYQRFSSETFKFRLFRSLPQTTLEKRFINLSRHHAENWRRIAVCLTYWFNSRADINSILPWQLRLHKVFNNKSFPKLNFMFTRHCLGAWKGVVQHLMFFTRVIVIQHRDAAD